MRVDINDTAVIHESLIWIWFRTNDQVTRVIEQTEILLDGNDYGVAEFSVKIDSLPSVSGIKISLSDGDKGILCLS